MGDQKSDDWLPEGWRVEVRVRKNGRKDKCYFPPSGGGKFFSKLEVSRYLNNGCHESEQEEKSANQQSSKKVVIEKATPEGLPPGWTKEVKVTKKGGRIRRDPFYTDPVSGYVFRSLKDALRYLETGEFGSQAFKRKDRINGDMELEDDKNCSPAVSKKPKSAVNETSSLTTSYHSSKLSGNVENKRIATPASTGECAPLSDQASGGSRIASSCSEFPMGRVSFQPEPMGDASKSMGVGAPAVSGLPLPDKHSVESGITKNETKRPELSRSKKKKDSDLPRRASKRLAGIPLEPMLELETSNRARRAADKQSNKANIIIDVVDQSNKAVASTVAVKESNKAVASTSEGSSSDNPKSVAVLPDSNKGHHPITNVTTTVEQALERETDNEGYKKHETANISTLMDLAAEQSAVKSEAANSYDEKLGLPLDLPFGELWQDPCIAFAIKTLTGMSFDDNSDSMKVSQGSTNSEFGAFGTSEEHAQIEDTGTGGEQNQRCGVVLPRGNLTIPEEPAREVAIATTEKCDEQPDIPFQFPTIDVWADPCIEFAIKTLTDAIPLDYNMIFQDHQQASSSQSQERGGSTLPNADDHC